MRNQVFCENSPIVDIKLAVVLGKSGSSYYSPANFKD